MLTFTVIFMSPKSFGWQALTMQGSSFNSIDIFLLAKGVTSIVFCPSTNPHRKKIHFNFTAGSSFKG